MLKRIKQLAIGTRASKAISSCLSRPLQMADGSKYLTGDKMLDGADFWHTYIQDNQNFGLTPVEKSQFEKDYYASKSIFSRKMP